MRAGPTWWPHSSLCVLVAERKPPRAQRMEGLGLCLCVVKLAFAGVKGVWTAVKAALSLAGPCTLRVGMTLAWGSDWWPGHRHVGELKLAGLCGTGL